MNEKNTHWLDPAFEAIAIDDEGRACADIPDSACREEAGNFFTHVTALTLSKSADSLIDPKLVLSWLLTALGAPVAMIGLLVPIRESGALLPQLVTAGALRRLPQRKWAWSAGAFMQGLAALAIAFAAVSLSGALAGGVILVCLGVLSLARSVCSVSYKDVLGKTVDKSRRGRATGLAGSLAAVTTLVFAAILTLGWFDRLDVVVIAIVLAGVSWMTAAGLFTRLAEASGATEGGKAALGAALNNLVYLKTQPQLRLFILTRALLTATALAPPFMISSAAGDGRALESLGYLVFASAAAALVSSFVWGRLADRSSRRVLIIAASVSSAVLAVTTFCAYTGRLSATVVLPGLLFVLMISYQGVRLGRSTHLVDMANEETRAAYTAISNTVIGLVLVAGAGFSVLASAAGAKAVIAVMALMCVGAIPMALALDEVQRPSGH